MQLSKELTKGRSNPDNKPETRGRYAKFSTAYMIGELMAGKTVPQFAALVGCSDAAIYQRLRENGISIKSIQGFKARKADLMAWKQGQIVDAMSPDKIEAASLRDQATALNILNNIERLERGQSTANLAMADISAELGDLEAEERRLRSALLGSPADASDCPQPAGTTPSNIPPGGSQD